MHKSRRIKLLPESYRVQSMALFDASGWRCEMCGRIAPLHRHHVVPRSQMGGDEAGNFMALCFECHRKLHQGKRRRDTR